jgi:hypothetical protein
MDEQGVLMIGKTLKSSSAMVNIIIRVELFHCGNQMESLST